MKTLRDFDFKNKRVLVRCDFNVALDEKGKVTEDFRIKQTLPTIEYLIEKGAKIILMSHLGDPEGKAVESLRLTPVKEKLTELLHLPIVQAPDCLGPEVEELVFKLKPAEALLLENLRFHKEEKENNEEFAKALAKLADIYINDAFAACHRPHASIVGIVKYLPSGAGLLLKKEIEVLSRVLGNPSRPLVVIIGGVKISTKIGVISNFLEVADHLLLGGEVANTILIAKGLSLGKSLTEDEGIEEKVKKIDVTNLKIHLPIDGIICLGENRDGYLRRGAIGTIKNEEKIFDIGPETVKMFSGVIENAETILWAGPLGLFEEEKFENGTKQIAQSVAENKSAFKILGGGDTIAAVDKFGLLDRFNHVSTGGGAMLEFLSGKKLPGIEALKELK